MGGLGTIVPLNLWCPLELATSLKNIFRLFFKLLDFWPADQGVETWRNQDTFRFADSEPLALLRLALGAKSVAEAWPPFQGTTLG